MPRRKQFVCKAKTISHLHNFQPSCHTPLLKSKSYGNWNQISRALEGIPSRHGKCPSAMSCCHTFRNFYSGCMFFFAEPFALCRWQFERLKLQSIVDPNPQPFRPPSTPTKKNRAVTNGDEKEKSDWHTHLQRVWGKSARSPRENWIWKIVLEFSGCEIQGIWNKFTFCTFLL